MVEIRLIYLKYFKKILLFQYQMNYKQNFLMQDVMIQVRLYQLKEYMIYNIQAKIFKEEFNKINSKKFPDVLNLYSMRLGVTTLIALANQKPI